MYKSLPKFFLGLSLGIASLAVTGSLSGCHNGTDAAAIPDNSGPDPADANMAPVSGAQAPAPAQGRVLGIRSASTPQQNSEEYAQQTAPPPQNEAYTAAQTAQPQDQTPDQGYDYNAPQQNDD